MDTTIYFLAGIIGLTVGSFLNVVILRGENRESLGGRSRCDACKHALSVSDLIPVISFILRRRQCRYCTAKLSWQYPLVELFAGIFFFLAARIFFSNGISIQSLMSWTAAIVGGSAAIIIFVADLRLYVIPDKPLAVLLFSSLVALYMRSRGASGASWENILFDINMAFLPAIFFAALWFASQGKWIGLGDAKLVFVTSLILGYPLSIAGFLLSIWIGALGAIFLILFGAKGPKDQMPLGPYILIGTAAAYLWGRELLSIAGLIEFL